MPVSLSDVENALKAKEQGVSLAEVEAALAKKTAPPSPGLLPQLGQAVRQAVFPVPEAERALKIGVSGAVGAVPDILNAPGAISQMVGGPQIPRVPLGSEDIARRLGVDPTTLTAAERIWQSTAGAAAPGAFLRAMGQVGVAGPVAARLYRFFSAGPQADILLGTTSAVGAETARTLYPETPLAPLVGAIAAPVGLTALRASVTRGARLAGKRIVARQDVTAAEEALSATQARATATLDDLTQRATTARAALEEEVTRTGQVSTRSLEDAKEMLAQTFAPVEDIVVASGALPRGAHAAPDPLIVGQQVLAQGAAEQAGRVEHARQGVRRLVEGFGPARQRLEVLGRARQFFSDEWFRLGKSQLGAIFDATEQVTGDAPVVDVSRVRQAAAAIAEETAATGQAAPRATTAAAQFGMTVDEAREVLRLGEHLPPAQLRRAEAILTQEGAGAFVPFWLARRMESGLQAAQRSRSPIGTLTQGRTRYLLSAMRDALHDFYASPDAAVVDEGITQALRRAGMPEDTAASIAGALPLARQHYRDLMEQATLPLVRKILSTNVAEQRQFLRAFTSPGGDPEVISDVMRLAPPDVRQMLKAFSLGDLYEQARATGQFDPKALFQKLAAFRRSGKMERLYDPEELATIERHMAELTAADPRHAPAIRQALAKKAPEEILPYAFAPGNITTTQLYKSVVGPQTYDESVKAFLADFLRDTTTLEPPALAKKYGPMVQRGRQTPSQLDIMLTEYPGAADAITDLFTALPRREAAAQGAALRAKRTAEAGKELLRGATPEEAAVQRAKEEAMTLEQFAQTRLDDARKRAKLAPGVSLSARQVGGINIHAVGKGAVLFGIAEAIAGVLTGSTYHTMMGATVATAASAGELFSTWANSATGRRVLREGLANRWGPSNARFVLQALGGTPPAQLPAGPVALPPGLLPGMPPTPPAPETPETGIPRP